jgi:hypothetical protein
LSATFVDVSGSRSRFAFWVFLPVLVASSCAVFPDEAILPISAQAGDGSGSTSGSTSSLGGRDILAGSGGETETPITMGGVSGLGGGASFPAGAGGVDPEPVAGAGGTSTMGGAPDPGGGAPGCDNLQKRTLPVTSDTWIEQAKPGSTHGQDALLSLVGAPGAEERLLLVLPVPARPDGVVLLRATLQLTVEVNEDASLAERQLSLHLLTQDYVEDKASWTNYSNGASKKWAALGGDFAPAAAADATFASSTSTGPLNFDVTAAVEQALGATAVPLSVIILESGIVPAAPAKLAFASAEGDATGPSLVVEFCPP